MANPSPSSWAEPLVAPVSAEDTFEALCPYVVPIYGPERRSRPEVVGSGVLLRVSADTLLLTAAHVLDERVPLGANEARSLYLPAGKDLAELKVAQENHFRSYAPNRDRNLDRLDYGVVRLPSALAKAITEYKWLVPANLQLTETGRASSRERYSFMGYPSSQSKRRPDRGTIGRACRYTDGEPLAPDEVLAKGLKPEAHIVVPLEKRKGTRLAGMSGGAVWSLRGHLREGPRLAGIAIEEWKDQGVLVGVRIRLVVAAAAERFPDLAFALPPIREISVTIQPQ
jgi:hypothetical protein